MRIVIIISVCLAFTMQAKAQSTIKGSFTSKFGIYKRPSYPIELKDSIGNSIIIYNIGFKPYINEGIVVNSKKYNAIRFKKHFILTDSLTKDCIGVMKTGNYRTFSFDGNDYKASRKNRNGYSFVINDKYMNPVSYVKVTMIKNEYIIEICNKGDDNILPFVFANTWNRIYTHKVSVQTGYFILITSIISFVLLI